MTLTIAPGLVLPDDFATQGVAVIGVRGSGKSNTEVRYAELLHAAGIPFVAIDPKGDWYGIRMDGTGPGLPVPVFGGLYGDFPLDDVNGARIADLLVDENLSAVLDVSRLSKPSLSKFLTAFCRRLMQRHQEEPHVRCVILEEAHRYIPQMVSGRPAAELKEATSSLLIEGRAFGLGCWAATQRPARLHNDVLEEVDTAVIHRIGVTATADLKRVGDWARHEELGPEVVASLTKLKQGEAWVLSPVALGIVERVQIDRRTTFDSGATPTVGAKKRALATMATIDQPAIKEALAESIERANRDDPKMLHERIRFLETDAAQVRRALEAAQAESSVEVEKIVEREVPALDEETVERLVDIDRWLADLAAQLETNGGLLSDAQYALGQIRRAAETIEKAARPVIDAAREGLRTAAEQIAAFAVPAETAAAAREPRRPRERVVRGPDVRSAAGVPDSGSRVDESYRPRAGARRMLQALATYPDGLTVAQIGTLAKIKKTGGTFGTYLSELVRAGLVVCVSGSVKNGKFAATDAGVSAVGGSALPSDPAELRAEWRSRLKARGAKAMFDVLVDVYPEWVHKQGLAEDQSVDLAYGGGTFGDYLSRLRSNGLIEEDAELVRAHPDLFLGDGR